MGAAPKWISGTNCQSLAILVERNALVVSHHAEPKRLKVFFQTRATRQPKQTEEDGADENRKGPYRYWME